MDAITYDGYENIVQAVKGNIADNEKMNALAKEQRKEWNFTLTYDDVCKAVSENLKNVIPFSRENALQARKEIYSRLQKDGIVWEEE